MITKFKLFENDDYYDSLPKMLKVGYVYYNDDGQYSLCVNSYEEINPDDIQLLYMTTNHNNSNIENKKEVESNLKDKNSYNILTLALINIGTYQSEGLKEFMDIKKYILSNIFIYDAILDDFQTIIFEKLMKKNSQHINIKNLKEIYKNIVSEDFKAEVKKRKAKNKFNI
jgi:hypothetical protein